MLLKKKPNSLINELEELLYEKLDTKNKVLKEAILDHLMDIIRNDDRYDEDKYPLNDFDTIDIINTVLSFIKKDKARISELIQFFSNNKKILSN